MRASIGLIAAALLVVAGCGSAPSTPAVRPSVAPAASTDGGSDANGGHGVEFVVTVSFTGAAQIDGSFVDRYTGRTFSSCAAYVNAPLWNSPGAVTGTERLEGLPVMFDFATAPGQFYGPGHYAPGVMGRVSIGADTFSGTESWVTLREDGSGSGWFTDFGLVGAGQSSTPESGTVSWTCSD
jgi:hypothetical protein